MAVVHGYDAWQRLTGIQPSFAELLLGFPEVEEIARDPAVSRDLGL
jgi:hypothetical protein